MDNLLPITFVEIHAAVIAQKKLRKPKAVIFVYGLTRKTLTLVGNYEF